MRWSLLLLMLMLMAHLAYSTELTGCTENSTTKIVDCTSSITGNFYDTDNSSIWVHDAVIDATAGDFLRLNTTLDFNITLENVTINANGAGGGAGTNCDLQCNNFDQSCVGGNAGAGGSSKVWFTSYTYIYNSTINAYGGSGGIGGYGSVTEGSSNSCDASGGSGGAGGVGNITGYFIQAENVIFNSYGGNADSLPIVISGAVQ